MHLYGKVIHWAAISPGLIHGQEGGARPMMGPPSSPTNHAAAQ